MREPSDGLIYAKMATFRILPRKGNALLSTVFAVIFLIFVNSGIGTVSVNGRVVTGPEREQTLNKMRLIFDPFFVAMLVWYGRRLLPESPYDHLEITPEALAVAGIFGLRRLPWEAIRGFSVSYLPLTRPPVVWITVRMDPDRNAGRDVYRIGMGGYVAHSFNPFSSKIDGIAEISSWLARVKDAYGTDSTPKLPAVPAGLESLVIEVEPPSVSTAERR